MKRAKSIYSKRIRLYKRGCDLLNSVLGEICDNYSKEKKADMQDIVMLGLGNRIIGTSKAIYELTMRGYQFDVAILVRSLVETSFVLWYVSKNENNTEKWLSGKIKFRGIKKELIPFPNENLKQFYDRQSDFVHSNVGPNLSLLEESKTKKTMIECRIEPWKLADEGNFLGDFWAFPLLVLSTHYKDVIRPGTDVRIKRLIAKVRINRKQ